ncbi:polyhydroxyalkanoate synthesis repressor PhaR [Gluconacetobacter tumulicola]|uniref:Polyhydroxyalkanoate synthesis repressor PhaR n=1 Tax=Gluconacetobacter tumulicola TaxID=1017177 RepID=A0A7W4JBK8_9PROT|nr:polyhydroxyalkanoate synthesis repressor PhaR [Gluconacetobacter tumulicola]MBB2178022.1 polyhydroxyalkanoate synthesis repressor PhaR [Gluconacetobacter tumulicola]
MEGILPDASRPCAPVVIKKYANRRLYDTERSIYVTLDALADMVRSGRDFVVFDARTGDDITRAVLTQIIMEEETKGRAMLPASFLRQIIRFYGDSMQGLVPDYLDQMMERFAANHHPVRTTMQRTMAAFLPPEMESLGRQDIEMMDRAMSVFASFREPAASHEDGNGNAVAVAEGVAGSGESMEGEVLRLRREVAALRAALAASSGAG